MPFEDAYQKGLIKSNVADLVKSDDRYGASSVASSFLKNLLMDYIEGHKCRKR